jgi:fimbrial chaperone protein
MKLAHFSALAAALVATSALAGSFTVTPVRIDIVPLRRAASIEIQNTGTAPAQLQAERYRWTRDNGGDDELAPTEDFVVTPPIMQLAPGQKQIVRVLLLVPPDPARELAFRLILQETPLGDPPPNTVATVLRISLPVFVAAPNAQPELAFSQSREGGRWRLTAHNKGGAHSFIVSSRTVDGDKLPVDGYVLPGESRTWPVAVPVDRIVLTQRDGAEVTMPVAPAP